MREDKILTQNEKEIYLAGGCFWGTEAFFKKIDGVKATSVGYANGNGSDTDYQRIKSTDHAETVHIIYDKNKVNLTSLLAYYFQTIDPTSVNKQGNDVGRQYRTGIFYTDESDRNIIESFLKYEQTQYGKKLEVLAEPLKNYVLAEDYHQDYLDKHVNGYCHVNLNKVDNNLRYKEITESSGILERIEAPRFKRKNDDVLRKELSTEQYEVTQNAHTERAFSNEYWDNHKKGIYVDITTGEPLFSSTNKYDSGCGWPSFTKPIEKDIIDYKLDETHGMVRTEVRSKLGNSHLGHVFEDGPKNEGGKRYCINSASLHFIPYEDMDKEGYSDYKKYVE